METQYMTALLLDVTAAISKITGFRVLSDILESEMVATEKLLNLFFFGEITISELIKMAEEEDISLDSLFTHVITYAAGISINNNKKYGTETYSSLLLSKGDVYRIKECKEKLRALIHDYKEFIEIGKIDPEDKAIGKKLIDLKTEYENLIDMDSISQEITDKLDELIRYDRIWLLQYIEGYYEGKLSVMRLASVLVDEGKIDLILKSFRDDDLFKQLLKEYTISVTSNEIDEEYERDKEIYYFKSK